MKEEVFALVAHDHRKEALLGWIAEHKDVLALGSMVCTGTTGSLVAEYFREQGIDARVTRLKSGPLGGDQQLGSMIAEGKVDYLIFFWDPMEPQPHDVDVKALLRLAVLYNIPTANNRSTADFLITSPLIGSDYVPEVTDYSTYIKRNVQMK